MMKTVLFAMALASLALAGGCAKGGNGVVPPPPITIDIAPPSAINANALYPTQSVTLTATPSSGPVLPVTWSLGPAATCTGSPNPCGTLTPVTPATTPPTATYAAPATPISSVTVTATSTTSSVTGTLGITVIPVTVIVTPLTANVGVNLVQKFTAIAVPDDAPQTFTWSPPTCNNGNCGSISPDPNNSDVAVYTAGSVTQSVTVAATSTVMQSNPAVGTSKVAVISSRLPAGGYEFWFSGQDNGGDHVAVVGSLHVDTKGVITGVEDVLSASGPEQLTVNSGSYTPISLNNELGTLRLSLSSGATDTYTAVITSSDLIRMVESDNTGITGSGVMQVSSSQQFNAGATPQTFAFGFTGVDSTGKRVGYVGMLTTDGTGTITGGMVDTNDNGNTANVCGASPCSVAASSSYQPDQTFPGLWNMTLTSGSSTQHFDFVVGAGVTQTKTAVNPLTLYAISTDPPVDAAHPALSGTMVYQVPMTYNNAAFNGTSVSALTGANANVSLTVGTTDGTSGGTGGAGGFTGTSDQNDNGTIISVPSTKPFAYTYVASGTAGRYTLQMLGDPNATTVVPPLTFVLYASGANRGFLLELDQLTSVMTGTMDPQLPPAGYTPSELPGTYAAVPVPNSNSTLVTPAVENLLLTSPGGQVYNVAGEQNPGNGTLTGLYTMNDNSTGGGTGTITLTSPLPPAVTDYVIYAINGTTIPNPANSKAPNFAITDFMMMGTCTPQAPATTCTASPSSIIFAQQ